MATPSRKNTALQRWQGNSWIWAIALGLFVGIVLRWVNLPGKVFWHDEVYTALRVSGYVGPEVERQLFTGVPFTAQTLLQYQTFAPDSAFADTWRSLLDHPEHPPLYFVLVWAWVKGWGTSITAFRSLSVVFSVLTLPVVALLAHELFGRHPAVAIAPLLLAGSPVQILYAQEARGYSLWVGLIILASWACLRAIRLNRPATWAMYAIALALAFYTSLFSSLIGFAHSIYGFSTLPRRQWWPLLIAQAVAAFLFVPWLLVILVQASRFQEVTAWTLDKFPRAILVKLWGLHFAAAFFDLNLPLTHGYTYGVPPLVLVLIALSIFGCWRRIALQPAKFLGLLLVLPSLVLIGGDLLRGGRLSSETRYFLPMLAIAQVAVAGWLGSHLRERRRVVLFALTALMSLELISSAALVQAPAWWNKRVGMFNYEVAAAIAAFPQPLILKQHSPIALGDLISLSYFLPPETLFQVTFPPTIPEPVEGGGHTLLLHYPTETMQQAYGCLPELLPGQEPALWKVPCP